MSDEITKSREGTDDLYGIARSCATTTQAAPSVVVFDGWAPRTQAERAFCDAAHSVQFRRRTAPYAAILTNQD